MIRYKDQINNKNLNDYRTRNSEGNNGANKMEKQEKLVTLEGTGEIELPKLDLQQYIGKKTLISEVTEHEGAYGYFVKVATAVIDVIGEGEKKIELQASRIFGLQEDVAGNIGWGKETKLGLFLSKMGVSHYNDLVGKEVIIQLQQGKDGKEYLTF